MKQTTQKLFCFFYDLCFGNFVVFGHLGKFGNLDILEKDIEDAIGEVKKQCGPPPRHLVLKYQKERAMQDVENARTLQKARKTADSERHFGARLRHCFQLLCCCCRRQREDRVDVKDNRTVAMRMIDRKLQDIGRETGAKDMDSFGLDLVCKGATTHFFISMIQGLRPTRRPPNMKLG